MNPGSLHQRLRLVLTFFHPRAADQRRLAANLTALEDPVSSLYVYDVGMVFISGPLLSSSPYLLEPRAQETSQTLKIHQRIATQHVQRHPSSHHRREVLRLPTRHLPWSLMPRT